MAEISENASTKLPDHASVEAVLSRLPAGAGETVLAAALTQAFPGFAFSAANLDDQYWRDTRSVLAADGRGSLSIGRGWKPNSRRTMETSRRFGGGCRTPDLRMARQ